MCCVCVCVCVKEGGRGADKCQRGEAVKEQSDLSGDSAGEGKRSVEHILRGFLCVLAVHGPNKSGAERGVAWG